MVRDRETALTVNINDQYLGIFILVHPLSTYENFKSQHICLQLYLEDVKTRVVEVCCLAEWAMELEKQMWTRCADSESLRKNLSTHLHQRIQRLVHDERLITFTEDF